MYEDEEVEISDDELAACGLMLELVRSARIITVVGDLLLEHLDAEDHPGEMGEVQVLRGMIETAMPELREAGAKPCWQAAELIEKIRSLTVQDFQLTTKGKGRY